MPRKDAGRRRTGKTDMSNARTPHTQTSAHHSLTFTIQNAEGSVLSICFHLDPEPPIFRSLRILARSKADDRVPQAVTMHRTHPRLLDALASSLSTHTHTHRSRSSRQQSSFMWRLDVTEVGGAEPICRVYDAHGRVGRCVCADNLLEWLGKHYDQHNLNRAHQGTHAPRENRRSSQQDFEGS